MPTLHWIGKEKVVKHHHEVPFKTLQQEYVYRAPEGTPENSTNIESFMEITWKH